MPTATQSDSELGINCSFEHPKHMFKLMGKKKIHVYAKKMVYLNL